MEEKGIQSTFDALGKKIDFPTAKATTSAHKMFTMLEFIAVQVSFIVTMYVAMSKQCKCTCMPVHPTKTVSEILSFL